MHRIRNIFVGRRKSVSTANSTHSSNVIETCLPLDGSKIASQPDIVSHTSSDQAHLQTEVLVNDAIVRHPTTNLETESQYVDSNNFEFAGAHNPVDAATPLFDRVSLGEVADFYERFSDLHTEVRIMLVNNKVVHLLGTNHADPRCPIEVAEIMQTVQPQIALIELCAWRACGCPVHRGNIFQTRAEFTFRYLRRVISQIGFLPAMIFFTDAFNESTAFDRELLEYGGEFAVAAHVCDALGNCKIVLADREIPITVRRQASAMSNWRGIRLTVLVLLSLIFKRRMRRFLQRGHRLVTQDPYFYQVVVLERDIFLAYMIQRAVSSLYMVERPQIVAVVGQGHLNGIQRFWGKDVTQILPFILGEEV